ncbi:MAG: hypothetical protein KH828_04440 [Clostridiales bacterium]|nr:hypothetical protein [Clostridiales bacterium]
MKAIKYVLKIIHKKEIVLASIDRKRIEETLKTMLQSEKEMDVTGDELIGIVVEEKDERDCPGACEGCEYFCPNEQDCMMDDLSDRCQECEYHCENCGGCTMLDCGECGEEVCEKCHWKCQECGSCTHPQGEKQP